MTFLLNCSDKDDCATYPCHNAGTCEDELYGFYCKCYPQFTGATCDVELGRLINIVTDEITEIKADISTLHYSTNLCIIV